MKKGLIQMIWKYFFALNVLIFALSSTSAKAASSPIAELNSEFVAGLIGYSIDRGYIDEHDVSAESEEIDAYLRLEDVSPDVGRSVDVLVAIPLWSFQFKLRKADYNVTDHGPLIKNKEFSIVAHGQLRQEVSGSGWSVVRLSFRDIRKASVNARVLDAFAKESIVAGVFKTKALALSRYRFSTLSKYENRLWVLNLDTNELCDVSSAGDLDGPLAAPLTSRVHIIEKFDIRRAILGGRFVSVNSEVLHGLWACLANHSSGNALSEL